MARLSLSTCHSGCLGEALQDQSKQRDKKVTSEEPKDDKDALMSRLVSWQPGKGARSKAPAAVDFPGQKGAEASGGMDRRVKRKRWTARRIAGMSLAGIFVGAVLYELLLGDHRSKLNVQVERITISTVERGPFQEIIPERGEVLPIFTFYLEPMIGGQVEEVLAEEGSMVAKGDPLLRLSNPSLERSVMSQETQVFEQLNNIENTRIMMEQQAVTRQEQLMNIEHELVQKKREYLKNRKLIDRDLIKREDYEQSKEDYDYWLKKQDFMVQTMRQDSLLREGRIAQLASSAGRLRTNLEALRETLESLSVRAPVSGQLSSLNAEIGEMKSPGQRLGQIDVLDAFKVRAAIDEFYIARISSGLTGTFQLAGEDYDLVLKKVYPEVLDGQFEVDLEFVGRVPPDIRRGQTLQIRLALGDLSEAILLPRGGFYQTTGGNWVFAVDASGSYATRKPIRTGRQNPEFFEILEGLAPGEQVVTSSYENYEEIEKLILKR